MLSLELVAAGPALSKLLGVPVRLSGAERPLESADLSSGERSRWEQLPEGRRRDEWLLGRAALKPLMPAWGRDTSALAFPHPRLSLTHGGGVVVAARCDGGVQGVGVDLEPWRPEVDARVGRFFLGGRERAWLYALRPRRRARAVIRLWTVKEALFKASAGNAGASLLDYEVDDPGAGAGGATGVRAGGFRYATVELGVGSLTVAVAVRSAGVAV